MNNCFQVLDITRPNFYVKLELSPGKCYHIGCQGVNSIQKQDYSIQGAAPYVLENLIHSSLACIFFHPFLQQNSLFFGAASTLTQALNSVEGSWNFPLSALPACVYVC